MRARAIVPVTLEGTLARVVPAPDGTPEEALRPLLQRDADALVKVWRHIVANLVYEALTQGVEIDLRGTVAGVEFKL